MLQLLLLDYIAVGFVAQFNRHFVRKLLSWHVDIHIRTHKLNVFPGFIVEHFYIKFGGPSCIFYRCGAENRQTHRQTEVKKPTLTNAVCVGIY